MRVFCLKFSKELQVLYIVVFRVVFYQYNYYFQEKNINY